MCQVVCAIDTLDFSPFMVIPWSMKVKASVEQSSVSFGLHPPKESYAKVSEFFGPHVYPSDDTKEHCSSSHILASRVVIPAVRTFRH